MQAGVGGEAPTDGQPGRIVMRSWSGLLVHVTMVVLSGFRRQIRAMTVGK